MASCFFNVSLTGAARETRIALPFTATPRAGRDEDVHPRDRRPRTPYRSQGRRPSSAFRTIRQSGPSLMTRTKRRPPSALRGAPGVPSVPQRRRRDAGRRRVRVAVGRPARRLVVVRLPAERHGLDLRRLRRHRRRRQRLHRRQPRRARGPAGRLPPEDRLDPPADHGRGRRQLQRFVRGRPARQLAAGRVSGLRRPGRRRRGRPLPARRHRLPGAAPRPRPPRRPPRGHLRRPRHRRRRQHGADRRGRPLRQ